MIYIVKKNTVIFYEKKTGECPVGEFLEGLPTKHHAKALREIELLEEFGLLLDSKTITCWMNMKTLRDHIKKQMKDSEFARENEALSEEYEIARKVIKARLDTGLTQKELAHRIGTKQSNMSRIENGNSNPSINTLNRIAKATGTKLHVEFI